MLSSFLIFLFAFVLSVLSFPAIFLFIEVLAAVFSHKKSAFLRDDAVSGDGREMKLAVLIPAHNEAEVIGLTLESVIGQLRTKDRLLVVADNCNDETAAIARQNKVEVVERYDDQRRGKGYALDFGIQALKRNPPDVVVILDADIQLAPDTLQTIAGLAFRLNRPVQAKYLLKPSPDAGCVSEVSAFAFLFKNHVRPLGLSQLGGGCLLTGTGMAFAWDNLAKVGLASSNLVEDMQLGIDLAIAGHSPLYCRGALVTSEMAPTPRAARQQRTRWEQGHFSTLLTQTLRLLQSAFHQQRFELFLLGMEILVPPLASFILLLLISFAAALLAAFFGAIPISFVFWSVGIVLILVFSVSIGWLHFGRDCLSIKNIFTIPLYFFWKIPIYIKLIFYREKKWNRTDRKSKNSI